MNENLFQYLWKNSLFKPNALFGINGEAIQILNPGRLNTDSGPDFKEGKIKINDTVWVGNIELHLKSSDWYKHGHQNDPNYQNIILHVVLEHDLEEEIGNFPTLELKSHLNDEAIKRYQQLMSQPDHIPCYNQIHNVPELTLISWLNRLLAERWEQKLKDWEELWKYAQNDWRTLLYYRMAANFGFHVNNSPFLDLAKSIPLKILTKHRKNLFQTEALLFGQSGLLNHPNQDDYAKELEREYHFLRRKYELTPLLPQQWKFMRMRPANFPTIRIAQFAMLVHKSLELFAKMMELKNIKEIYPLLELETSEYWNTHYRFSEIAKDETVKRLGKDAVFNIVINTVTPMQYLYSKLQGKNELQETSMELLQSIPAENNNITRMWKQIGIKAKDASESQALIHLFQNYCTPKDCLNCSIGNYLINTK